MIDSATKDMIELEVNDFGPVVAAKIDLRPLTVFIGPSNTGKSYLAILTYALHRHFSDESNLVNRRFRRMPTMFIDHYGSRKWPERTIEEFIDLAKKIGIESEQNRPAKSINFSDSIVEFIRSKFEDQGNTIGDVILRCFGVNHSKDLVRKGKKGSANIVLRKRNENTSDPIEHRMEINSSFGSFNTKFPDRNEIRLKLGKNEYLSRYLQHSAMRLISQSGLEGEPKNSHLWEFSQAIIDCMRPQIVGPLRAPAFYLPADRTGIMHAHSVVVGALIESAAMTGLRPAAPSMPMLSGVLADFLEQLIQLDRFSHGRRKPRHNLDKAIEATILKGEIGFDKSIGTGYPHYTYKPKGWAEDISLMHASSMVSELAPVVLYLRHVVMAGDVLIVEEPESHLHPAMQVEFTRQLASLVKAGIRVIVTTHSEWVLEELANTVRRSQIPKSRSVDVGGNHPALTPNQVGAWLFKQRSRPKGTVVEEVILDYETGLYPTDYDIVSENLYNESASIFRHIQSGNLK